MSATPAPGMSPAPARKRKPLALIEKDYCTGCEACISLCPIKNCINKSGSLPNGVCWVDDKKCIGCTLCTQICPWDCIKMVEPELAVGQKPQEGVSA